ncbi:metalloreductase-like protein transmembrane component [Eremomyces bilateralis CBS 781.70]|uniref:ferric-chelate reductase (NADPH) n=1 Tax=Eremomyces bilateralis CBS 781.70 TaxID=1392243 RepID=A0A6G1FSX5_9PEZI|nr:metalloreductase-like protein transmembrane component [Eremomyces bilateralis CBS 781.70]KAF1808781.1 metalloreductase-like protein transmembrane component [Eremomyces bilateralis CBS 781.70]
MPALPGLMDMSAEGVFDSVGHAIIMARGVLDDLPFLVKRINISTNRTSSPDLIEAVSTDPWRFSGKYALGWVYFCIILLVVAFLLRTYHYFTDRIRTALHAEDTKAQSKTSSPDTDYEMNALYTDKSTAKFFPRDGALPAKPKLESNWSSLHWVNVLVAMFRFLFYRPIPELRLRKGWRPIAFPSLAVSIIVAAAMVFTVCYCFIPQPLFYKSIAYGSPPLAIRAGMVAVSLIPWIVALSMKANFISLLTGVGHERLNVLHRWLAYLCLALSIVHTVPFYITPITDAAALDSFHKIFEAQGGMYIYSTGIACLVPLGFLCLHSLPFLRRRAYELFVAVHVPISIVFIGMLFWHCKNYLTSWHYLFATIGIWLASYLFRLLYLNWTHPFRMSWLVGDESAITLLPENAVKITIPTQVKWRPGQYVYLRMPGISVFENHPFTIASLCSDDFPSEYGDGYRDMLLVFRPFGGFTQKVVKTALEHGPWHTYRAFIDGPYGGMRRRIESFDSVVLIAGGSGITAIVSQLLDLIKRMRDGKAVTKTVQVIWALKRPETLEWFKEELRICREFAPPDSVSCQLYITAAKRLSQREMMQMGLGIEGQSGLVSAHTPTRPVSMYFHDKVNDVFQDIAEKRFSGIPDRKRLSNLSNLSNRNSALIQEEAHGDTEREEMRRENEDAITALPQAQLVSARSGSRGHLAPPGSDGDAPEYAEEDPYNPQDIRFTTWAERRKYAQSHASHSRNLSLDVAQAVAAGTGALDPNTAATASAISPSTTNFDFGFPSTPTEFQKNLMRFAFLPGPINPAPYRPGWSIEYGRPDIPFMLREASRGWGRRTCVFVCGPPSMRIAVSEQVAQLQRMVVSGTGPRGEKVEGIEEIFLHAENYAL